MTGLFNMMAAPQGERDGSRTAAKARKSMMGMFRVGDRSAADRHMNCLGHGLGRRWAAAASEAAAGIGESLILSIFQ